MPKPLKIVLIAVAALLVLVVGAVAIAATLFDPNDYRDRITAAVKKETGRDLTLGKIELNLFPWLKVRIDQLSFSNAPGFGDSPMAEVGEAAVGVQLLPLLFDRQVKVNTVTLVGLRLDLAKDAAGKTNWDDLIKPDEAETPQKDESGEDFKLESIDIAGVVLKDAAIVYRDAQTRQTYRLDKVNLETGALQPGQPVDIEASLSAIAEAQKMSGDLAFSATVLADLVAQTASIDKLKLDVKTKGEDLAATAALAGNVAANLQTQVVNIEGLQLDFTAALKDLSANGKLVGKVVADLGTQRVDVDGLKLDFKTVMKDLTAEGALSAKVKGALDTQKFELAGLSLNANAAGAAIPGGKQTVKLTGNAAYDALKGALRFTDGRINAAGLEIATAISGEGLNGDSPKLSGPISVASFNPRELLKTLGQEPIKTTDASALSSVSLSTRYSGSFKTARFDDVKLKLDQTSASGFFAVRDFDSQALEFALKVDKLDADRYLPPADPKTASDTPREKSGDLNSTELPIKALESINASGTLDVAELKIKGATLKDVRLKIDGPKGAAKMVQLDAQTYGGQIATRTRITPGARPTYSLDTSLTSIALAPVLQNFAGKDYVSGLGTIKFDLTSAGATVGDLRSALNGDIALNFQNGAVKGFNLGQIIRKGQALLKGEQFNATEPEQTDFTEISFAAKVVNGILKSDLLNAQSPLFRLGGAGEIDLVKETINYLASPTVVGSGKGQGGKGLEELAGLTIPIKLTGSLFDPRYKLDLQTALKQKAGDELRSKVADKLLGGDGKAPVSDAEFKEQVKQQAGEKIGKELGRGLEKLFGGKQKKEPAPAAAEPAAPTEPIAPLAPAETAPAAPAEAAPAP